MTPYYYDSPKKTKPIHPMYCIYPFIIYPIYLPTLLQPFIYPFYYNNFCLFFIFTLHVSPYHLSIYYTSIIILLFNNLNISFTPKCVFLLLFLNQGTNSFSHKGGRNVMILNHAQPAYTQGRMCQRFLPDIGTICETRRGVNPRVAFA